MAAQRDATQTASAEALLRSSMVADAAGAAPSNLAPEAGPPAQRRRVLLIEDHNDTAEVLRRLLEKDGHDVHVARSCAEARKLCRANGDSFNVILCDIGLPDGSGIDLVPCFRDHCRGARVVAITAYGMPDEVRAARAAGFDDLVLKPLRVEALQPLLA